MRVRVVAVALVLLAAGDATGASRSFGPWPDVTPTPAPRPVAAREPETSAVKLPFLWTLWFYRNAISPLDGVRCGMYPTCSGYATEAVRRHGVLAGGMLAADRLIHEGSARPPETPVIEKFGRRFLHDPVEANDRLFRDASPRVPAPSAVVLLPRGTAAIPPPAALLDAETAARLATSLALAGDAYRAVGEYRRAAFLAGEGPKASALLVEGGWAAGAAGTAARRAKPASWTAGSEAFDEADRLFDDAKVLAVRAGDDEAARRASYARAMTYLSRGYLPDAVRLFEDVAAGGARDDLAEDAAWLGAWSELSRDLASGRPADAAAKDRLEPFVADPERGESARGAIAEAKRDGWKRKSPTAAAVMSLVLPGSGYVYAGRPLVGLGSLLLNGAFIGATVAAVRDGNYPVALILLSLETGWYMGGATGAAMEIVERNETGRHRVERRLRKKYLGAVWPGGAAGAILF